MAVAFLRGNTLYALTAPGTWSATRATAKQLGGDLVAINDSGENSDLQREFSGGFWIGLSDAAQENSWRWSSGESNGYTNWVPGEPRSDTTANHAWMVNGLAYGQWAAQNGDGVVLPGLMEVAVIHRQNKAYLLAEASSMEELRQVASMLGGHLASIVSNDSNDWLRRELPGLVQRRYGVSAKAWGRHPLIGLSDLDGTGNWRWDDDSEIVIAPWAQGEPSDDGRNEPFAQLLISGAKAGQWNDSSFNGIGLIEVPLRPNQAAAGRLSVSGEPTVGSRLQLEVVGLGDGDGIGSTSIQWQRRHNDRRGWQPISGANNSTYQLSLSDQHLQLRAVVSLRDKADHEETLASAATATIAAAPVPVNLSLAPVVMLNGDQAILQLRRSGDRSSNISATLRWPVHELLLSNTGALVEHLPGAVRLQLQAGRTELQVPFRASGLRSAGFQQWELAGLTLDSPPGVEARWQQNRLRIRVLDPSPLPPVVSSALPAPPMQSQSSAASTLNPYYIYLLNYGPTLLESWREEGGVLQSQVWGERHYLGSGRAAGRALAEGSDSMDWGAAVLFAPGLYQQWQKARSIDPDLNAFNWGKANAELVRKSNRVRLGRENEQDRLQGHLVFGLSGNDVLTGTQANDLLVGGFGDDVLTSGGLGGEDWCYGGPGRDQFLLDGSGTMRIRDYTPGEDSLLVVNGIQRSSVRLEAGAGVGYSQVIDQDGQLLAELAAVASNQVQLLQG